MHSLEISLTLKGNHIQNTPSLLVIDLCICINLFMVNICLFDLYLKYLLFSVFFSWNIFTERYYNFFQTLFCETKKSILPHRDLFVLFIPIRLPLHLLQFEWLFTANEWPELSEIFYAQLNQCTFPLLKKMVLMSFSSTATFSTCITHFCGPVFFPVRRQMIKAFFSVLINKCENFDYVIVHAFFIICHLLIIFL